MKGASQSGAGVAAWGQSPSALRAAKASLAGAENKGYVVAKNEIEPGRAMDCLEIKDDPNIFMKTQRRKATKFSMLIR
jgi:hypothetical protein